MALLPEKPGLSWEEVVAQAKADEEKRRKFEEGSGTYRELLWAQLHYGAKVIFKSTIAAVLLVAVWLMLSWGSANILPFNPSVWKSPRSASGILGRGYLWNRFEHQYQIVGMKKSRLMALLGQPEPIIESMTRNPTICYAFGG